MFIPHNLQASTPKELKSNSFLCNDRIASEGIFVTYFQAGLRIRVDFNRIRSSTKNIESELRKKISITNFDNNIKSELRQKYRIRTSTKNIESELRQKISIPNFDKNIEFDPRKKNQVRPMTLMVRMYATNST